MLGVGHDADSHLAIVKNGQNRLARRAARASTLVLLPHRDWGGTHSYFLMKKK
jgi:hypothetical protein